MMYGDIHSELLLKLDVDAVKQIDDYRPASPMYTEDLDLSKGIIVWMKDGSKIIYIPKEAKGV